MGNGKKPKRYWRERRKAIRHRCLVPFVFVEWICEGFSYLLARWAFLEVLDYLGRLTIIIAVIFYFAESGSRRKAKHYQAWQVINSAQGKTHSGGRIDALQDLNRDRVSLAALDASNALLGEIDLENAVLSRANLSGADLYQANLSGANLFHADLSGAQLFKADLSGAILFNAILSGAKLLETNLSSANLCRADLSGADLYGANLSGADLSHADLSGAQLIEVDLSGADLTGSNLNQVEMWETIRSVQDANMWHIRNPPEGFLEWAKEQGAKNVIEYREWLREMLQKAVRRE